MATGPVIAVEQSSSSRADAEDRWTVEWRITNTGVGSIAILSARLPHGQFKSEEQHFEPPLALDAGEQIWFRARVRCAEPPGLVTENAFIIFQVVWLNQTWRIFVRIRVVVQQSREPQTVVELITTQRAGFSAAN
jgi:hypothetical protein